MNSLLYRPVSKESKGSWDAIVIGSGIGGMACAASLAKFGKCVLILEQHFIPGGFGQTFSRKGHTWDVGVHCVGEMGPDDIPGRMFRWLTNGRLKWESLGPTYETFFFPGDFKIEFPDNLKDFKLNLKAAFPDDGKAIDEYFSIIRGFRMAAYRFLASRVLPRWTQDISSFFMPEHKFWRKTTKEVLDSLTFNEKLKSVLAGQWGYYGSTPSQSSFGLHAMVVNHFIRGGYYPAGGAASIANGLLKTVSDAGGETLVRATVEEILIRGGRAVGVRLAGGQEFFAPKIISAAGARITAESLMPMEYKESKWAREILSTKQSPPHLCLYLGFEGDIEKAGVKRTNQWFFETWDLESSVWDLSGEMSECPALYLSFPSLKDPQHQKGPTHRHTAEVLAFVSWDSFSKWQKSSRGKRDLEYLAFKKTIEDCLVAQLKKHIPQLMELVTHVELSTPLSTVYYTGAPQGAIYGLETTPKRFTNKSLRTRTPVKGLYLAANDVTVPGVVGALMGGLLAASTVNCQVFIKLVGSVVVRLFHLGTCFIKGGKSKGPAVSS